MDAVCLKFFTLHDGYPQGRRPASRHRGAKVFADFRRLFLAEITNFNVFSGHKQVISKKTRRLIQAKITNFNVFSAHKKQLLPLKKIPRGARKKIRGGGGAKTKIGGKGGKNENRGALPPPLATRLATLSRCN